MNLYGPKDCGKNVLAQYATDLLIRKKIFTKIKRITFEKSDELEFEDEDWEKTLLILIYRPKKKNKE